MTAIYLAGFKVMQPSRGYKLSCRSCLSSVMSH